MREFDVGFIGGGPAGYEGAVYAAKKGLSVVLFEKANLGGVCLNEGCIPSKSLLNSAKLYEHARSSAAFGVTAENVSLDQAAVIKRKNLVVSRLVKGVAATVSQSLATYISGEAVVKSGSQEGYIVQCNEEEFLCKNCILACGSTALVPPIKGVEASLASGFALTNKEILDLEIIPSRLVIVGGGVIGLEMASYFATVGSSVTVVEMLDRIANPIDVELAAALQKSLSQRGVKFVLNAKVTEIADGTVIYATADGQFTLQCDKVLLSIGRKPVVVGLEHLGLNIVRGAVVTDAAMRTNLPNLYACGDINGKCMLAHAATKEAEVAVNNILGHEEQINYDLIPSVIYTSPEVGICGISEQQARDRGYDVLTANVPLAYSGRYVAENMRVNGFAKAVVDAKSRKLLGMGVIGSYASEFIVAANHLISLGVTVEGAQSLVYPHPTVCEIMKQLLCQF